MRISANPDDDFLSPGEQCYNELLQDYRTLQDKVSDAFQRLERERDTVHDKDATISRLEAENRDLRAKLETVRAETLEEAARVADEYFLKVETCRTSAIAIRSLKDKDQQNG